MTGEPGGDTDLSFVDTNILVYAYDRTDERKHEIARRLLDALWAARSGVLSTQVLTEFYAVATRRFVPPMTASEAREVVGLYAAWPVLQVDVPLIMGASLLGERHGLSFWDALIVEAARRAGAARVITEDTQSAPAIEGIRVENPFG